MAAWLWQDSRGSGLASCGAPALARSPSRLPGDWWGRGEVGQGRLRHQHGLEPCRSRAAPRAPIKQLVCRGTPPAPEQRLLFVPGLRELLAPASPASRAVWEPVLGLLVVLAPLCAEWHHVPGL